MKTVTTKALYEAIIRKRGYDPASANVAAAEQARIADWINERLEEIYEYYMWPEVLLVERRQYRATWESALIYALGAEVFHTTSGGDEKYYISLQGANTAKNPETETAWWAEVGDDFLRTIDYQQAGETEISAVDLQECAYDYDPRIYRGKGRILEVEFYGDALIINSDDAPTRPWIKFRPPAPQISLTAWSAATNYAIGDLCYLAATGESYKALAANADKQPDSETAYWEPVSIPALFQRYLAHAVHADFLLDPIERDKERAQAEKILGDLEDRQINQQGVARKITFRK
ncbi:MAG: hypothetical protein PHX05_00120 [Acidobacteriota bacterium]|nr:hypothetical protein [Acidobacteriota bacterium]